VTDPPQSELFETRPPVPAHCVRPPPRPEPPPPTGARTVPRAPRRCGRTIKRLRKRNREGRLSLQYQIIDRLARRGFLTSKELRVIGRNDRGQSAPQRLRDVPLYGLTLFGPLEWPETLTVAERELSVAERHALLEAEPRTGRTWVLERASRPRAWALVARANRRG